LGKLVYDIKERVTHGNSNQYKEQTQDATN